MRRLAFLPFLLFVGLVLLLYVGLQGNPQEIPSVLVGKPAPDFALAAIEGAPKGIEGLSKDDLMAGEVVLLNVWASWCGPCRVEHPVLMGLAEAEAVPIYGLNYKDKGTDALQFLEQLGDPFTKSGADVTGRTGIDFGVYGVPETFVINGKGEIIHKHVGPLTKSAWIDQIEPIVSAARGE